LSGEPVRTLGHPIADRKVALLLGDGQQRIGQLDGSLWAPEYAQAETIPKG
jgi:hypothetical protein